MRRRDPRTVLTLICLGSAGLWVLLYFLSAGISYYRDDPNILLSAELGVVDQRIRNGKKAPVAEACVFVGIDRSNYSEDIFPEDAEAHPELSWISREWPFPRQVYAFLIERLFDAGAHVVAVDLLMPNAGEGDDELARVIARYEDRLILGANIMDRTEAIGNTIRTHNEFRFPNPTLIDALNGPVEETVAYVNFFPDIHSGNDGTIRSALFSKARVDTDFHSLSALTAIKAGYSTERLSSTEHQFFRFAGPPNTYEFISLLNFIDPVLWNANLAGKGVLKDKIVLIGPYGNWSQDFHNTPYPTMLGPEIHLQALGAILQNAFYQNWAVLPPPAILRLGPVEIPYPSSWTTFGSTATLVLILALLPLPFFLLSPHPIIRSIIVLTLALLWVMVSLVLYNQMDVMVSAVTPLLALASSGVGGIVYQFVRDQLERAKTRSYFEKYVSSNVVAELLNRPEEFEDSLGGKRLPCTILFSDIRGFTTMTETGDSQQIVQQLNEYLTEMVECVFRHEGTLDKFIGDAVMAVWGNAASRGPQDDAREAVLSALEMLEALDQLNTSWKSRGMPELKIGIGINHGEVIAGDMGSPRRKDFTVIGDAVNLAARLEGLTKPYGVPLMLGESVTRQLGAEFVFQTIDRVQVKGKSRPVDTFGVAGWPGHPLSDPKQKALAQYEEGVVHFREKRFPEAIRSFESARSLSPDDPLISLYLDRCREFIDCPPPDDWNGIAVMTSK